MKNKSLVLIVMFLFICCNTFAGVVPEYYLQKGKSNIISCTRDNLKTYTTKSLQVELQKARECYVEVEGKKVYSLETSIAINAILMQLKNSKLNTAATKPVALTAETAEFLSQQIESVDADGKEVIYLLPIGENNEPLLP